jgi:hypothetical protein
MAISKEVLDIFSKYYPKNHEEFKGYINIAWNCWTDIGVNYVIRFILYSDIGFEYTDNISMCMVNNQLLMNYKYEDKIRLIKKYQKKIDNNTIIFNEQILTEEEKEIIKNFLQDIIKNN